MVDIRKSTHRHHTRCIHSNTLVLLSLRLYRYRFVLFNKIRVHRTLLFVSLLGQKHESVRCPRPSVHQPARHSVAVARERTCYPKNFSTRHSVAVAKERTCYPEDRTHTRTRAHARLRTSVAIIPARRAARVQRARQSLDGAMYIRLRAQPDEVVKKVRIEKL